MAEITDEKQEEKDLKKKAKRTRKRVYEQVEDQGETLGAETGIKDKVVGENTATVKEKKKKKPAKKKAVAKKAPENVKSEETVSAAPKKQNVKTKKTTLKSKPEKTLEDSIEETIGDGMEETITENASMENSAEETSGAESVGADARETEAVAIAAVEKKKKAMGVINRYVVLSSGTALIPLPLVDLAASTGLQLKMLKDLCDLYEIPFSEHKGKAVLTSLIGGYHVGLIAGSFSKLVPIISLAGVVMSMFLVSGAVTYAVGMLFMYHFGRGGTLKDFEPDKNKENFKRHLKAGKESLKQAA